MRAPTHRVLLAAGLGLSLLLHGAAGVILYAGDRPAQPTFGDGAMMLTDVEVAPEAPEAHTPQAEKKVEPQPEPGEEPVDDESESKAEPDPEPAATVEPQLEVAEADAGVPDGGTRVAEAADAGVPDAGTQVAEAADAGVPDDGGTRVALAGDAGAPDDGGTRVAATTPTGDPTSGDPAGDRDAGPAPTGAGSNLLAYFPEDERVVALVRLDRFRGTPWAGPLEKIFRPMPDYSSLMGGRKTTMADLFDTLILSSDQPRDATATTVVVRYSQKPRVMRRFLDHTTSRVTWKSARGGAMGIRSPSRFVAKNDERVFMLPRPNLAVLARPSLLGSLRQPSSAPMDHFPPLDTLPVWIQQLDAIENESGAADTEEGPAAIASFEVASKKLTIPLIGEVVSPERVTLALEIHAQGFVFRGHMLFRSAKDASSFVSWTRAKRKELTESMGGKFLLERVKAFNAVKGLTLKPSGAKVAYATSISIADAREMVDRVAALLATYFEQARTGAEDPK